MVFIMLVNLYFFESLVSVVEFDLKVMYFNMKVWFLVEFVFIVLFNKLLNFCLCVFDIIDGSLLLIG